MLKSDTTRRFFGAWKEDEVPDAPSFVDVVDSTWQPDDYDAIVRYLEKAAIVSTIGTVDVCDFCNCQLGSYGWQSDGFWVWRTSLSHQVKAHRVRLPDTFVDHIRDANYFLPTAEQIKLDSLDWPFPRGASM